MMLPVNFLLYVSSAGLFGLAGWMFYETLPQGTWRVHEQFHIKGADGAKDLMIKVPGTRPTEKGWNYNAEAWKARWMAPNLLGKDPPKVNEGDAGKEPVIEKPKVEQRPLEEIIEILALAYESSSKGAGGLSHVIVEYRGDVQPPLWYLRENNTSLAAGSTGGPGDTLAAPTAPVQPQPTGPGNGRRRGGNAPRAPTPMPTSTAGQKILQTLWVAGDGTPRFESRLWPPHEHIKLVRVASDARVAYFVRDPQPAAAGEPAPPAPAEEPLYKSTMSLSQEVLKTIDEVLSKEAAERIRQAQALAAGGPAANSGTNWVEVQETQKIENVYHVARKENPDSLVEKVNVDSYVSRQGTGLRGVRIMNIEPTVAARFGVVQGDVILAVNNVPVTTKAEAINVGRRQYERGQRTFVVKFLSNGQTIERTYQAPDR